MAFFKFFISVLDFSKHIKMRTLSENMQGNVLNCHFFLLIGVKCDLVMYFVRFNHYIARSRASQH